MRMNIKDLGTFRYLKPMKFVSRTLINSNKSKYFTFIVLFVPDSVARFYHEKYKKNIENQMHSTLMSNVFMKGHITTYSGGYNPVGPKIFFIIIARMFLLVLPQKYQLFD